MLNHFELCAISYQRPNLRKFRKMESHAIDLEGPDKMVENKIVA